MHFSIFVESLSVKKKDRQKLDALCKYLSTCFVLAGTGMKISWLSLLASFALGSPGTAQIVSPLTENATLTTGTTTVTGTLVISPNVRVTVIGDHRVEGPGRVTLSGGNSISINKDARLILATNLSSNGNSFISGGDVGLYTYKSPKELNIASGNLDVGSDSSLDGWYFGGFVKKGAGTLTLRGGDNSPYFAGINEGSVVVGQGAALSVGSLFGTPQGTLRIDPGGVGVVSVPSRYIGNLVGGGSFAMYGRPLAVENRYEYVDDPSPQTLVTLAGDKSQFTGTYVLAAGTLALEGVASSVAVDRVMFVTNANATLSINGGTLRTKSLLTNGMKVVDPNVAPFFDGRLPSGQVIRAGGEEGGTLEVNLASGVTNRFDGTFTDGDSFLALSKTGQGRLVLGGSIKNSNSWTEVGGGVLQFAADNRVQGLGIYDGGAVERFPLGRRWKSRPECHSADRVLLAWKVGRDPFRAVHCTLSGASRTLTPSPGI